MNNNEKDDNLSPLGCYPGSKFRLMSKLMPLFPDHSHYVSVFGGLAGDLLAKPRSKLETFNDIDGNIYNLFQVLQKDGQRRRLIQRITYTPSSQRFYNDALRILSEPLRDPVESAWAFMVIANLGRCTGHPALQIKTNWAFNRTATIRSQWDRLPDNIKRVAERFRKVQVASWSWQKVIGSLDTAGTLFFLDPPYVRETLSLSAKHYYPHAMTVDDHRELLDRLQTIKGHAVLCGYSSPLYEDALSHWRRVHFRTVAPMSWKSKKPKRTEFVWMNYDENEKRLPATF